MDVFGEIILIMRGSDADWKVEQEGNRGWYRWPIVEGKLLVCSFPSIVEAKPKDPYIGRTLIDQMKPWTATITLDNYMFSTTFPFTAGILPTLSLVPQSAWPWDHC